MNISVIGTGYVGLTTGACFAELGMNVMCMDTDEEKINKINKGIVPFYEPGIEEMVKRNFISNNLHFTTSPKEAVGFSELIFIAVGTPTLKDNTPNLEYILEAVNDIALQMNEYKVIIIKSTVPVGTGKKVKKKIKDILVQNKKQFDFDVVSNPEFLREGSAIYDFMNPNKIVIGIDSKSSRGPRAKKLMIELNSFHVNNGTPLIISNIETAEMIKYVSNAFLATKISFINEVANMCEHCDADVSIVAKSMGLDPRIGSEFLNPGPGYGGSCFPKDTKGFMHIGKTIGYQPKIVKAVIDVNNDQINLMIKKIEKIVKKFKGKTISVLGVSFKPNTDDIRESPALKIINYLLSRKANVKIYDPRANDNCKKVIDKAQYCNDVYSACFESECIIVVTEWDEFKNIDFELLKEIVDVPLVIDLRNIYEPDYVKKMGFKYEGVGRK